MKTVWKLVHIFAGCLLQIHRGHSHTSLNGSVHHWRRSPHLEELGEMTTCSSPWATTTTLAPSWRRAALWLPSALAGARDIKQPGSKSWPGSNCTCPTGTTTGKRKERYINTTATKTIRVWVMSETYSHLLLSETQWEISWLTLWNLQVYFETAKLYKSLCYAHFKNHYLKDLWQGAWAITLLYLLLWKHILGLVKAMRKILNELLRNNILKLKPNTGFSHTKKL